ncbi:MAG: sulfotransferase, partial [Gammaproteobacteria bacterium]
GAIFNVFGDRITNRAFMTDWFDRRNQDVVDTLSPERLLVFSPMEGWAPLCSFLGVPVPDGPFPRVNSRDELEQASNEEGGIPPDPETAEIFARNYIEQLKAKAFGS